MLAGCTYRNSNGRVRRTLPTALRIKFSQGEKASLAKTTIGKLKCLLRLAYIVPIHACRGKKVEIDQAYTNFALAHFKLSDEEGDPTKRCLETDNLQVKAIATVEMYALYARK
jgi:hypothetical protein